MILLDVFIPEKEKYNVTIKMQSSLITNVCAINPIYPVQNNLNNYITSYYVRKYYNTKHSVRGNFHTF